jgi:hypothetical protein
VGVVQALRALLEGVLRVSIALFSQCSFLFRAEFAGASGGLTGLQRSGFTMLFGIEFQRALANLEEFGDLLVWDLVVAGVEDAVAQVGLLGAHESLCINVNQFAIRTINC